MGGGESQRISRISRKTPSTGCTVRRGLCTGYFPEPPPSPSHGLYISPLEVSFTSMAERSVLSFWIKGALGSLDNRCPHPGCHWVFTHQTSGNQATGVVWGDESGRLLGSFLKCPVRSSSFRDCSSVNLQGIFEVI